MNKIILNEIEIWMEFLIIFSNSVKLKKNFKVILINEWNHFEYLSWQFLKKVQKMNEISSN